MNFEYFYILHPRKTQGSGLSSFRHPFRRRHSLSNTSTTSKQAMFNAAFSSPLSISAPFNVMASPVQLDNFQANAAPFVPDEEQSAMVRGLFVSHTLCAASATCSLRRVSRSRCRGRVSPASPPSPSPRTLLPPPPRSIRFSRPRRSCPSAHLTPAPAVHARRLRALTSAPGVPAGCIAALRARACARRLRARRLRRS